MDATKPDRLRGKRNISVLGQQPSVNRQTAAPSKLLVTKAATKAKFSYGKRLDAPEPGIVEEGGPISTEQDVDWLTATEKSLQQDIETSRKELELTKSILEDMEQKSQTEKNPSRRTRDQKILMGACREFSASRIQILKMRLQNVNFWIGSRKMGRPTPANAPSEWLAIDVEWRHWLSDQAAARIDLNKGDQSEQQDGTARGILGPLPYIIAAYTWLEEQ
ncbi:hypothetical protein BJ170DRAFT_688138 [Xylariales sp. AK1849]|nr:hypothetical protein BJ170DRAFT_688138 [Xylariales sp. AK1849]